MIFEFKYEGRIMKDFRDYRNPTELFKNLRDGDVIPKEPKCRI